MKVDTNRKLPGLSVEHPYNLYLILIVILAFIVSVYSPVNYSRADSSGTLITAQAIAEKGTLRLDDYRPWIEPSYRFVEISGHYYYFYPPGTPLFIAPLVKAAGLTGEIYLPTTPADENLQNWISGLTVALSAVLIYILSRAFLPPMPGIFLTAIFVFGSSLISTMGTALWSSNLTVLFCLGALILIAYEARRKWKSLNPYWLGFFLFSAYLCRPSAALFVGVVGLYIAIYRRQYLGRVGLVLAGLTGGFMAVSFLEMHRFLPPYYLISDFSLSLGFFTALYGNLLSPSRGLFIFSPFLLVLMVGIGLFWKRLIQDRLFQLAGLWFLGHLFLISSWKIWSGGQSFGPRLFTDVLPALLLLSALLWELARQQGEGRFPFIFKVLLPALAVTSVFIHSYQGMYNRWTDLWNDGPAVNFLDWRYPQIFASPQQMQAREIDYLQRTLEPYLLGSVLRADSSRAVFENWYEVQPANSGVMRWSKGNKAIIYLRFEAGAIDPQKNYRFRVRLGGLPNIKTRIYFNDTEIGLTALPDPDPQNFVMGLPGNLIWTDQLNRLEFELDFQFTSPDDLKIKQDPRLVGIKFVELQIGE